MKFCEKVKMLREKAGLTQKQLAEEIGVSLRTVTNYENGSRYPKQRGIYGRLASLLGVEINYLLTEDEEFLLSVSENFGEKSADKANKILLETKALFAGGELSEEDARAFIDEIQRCYLDSKERSRKYSGKKSK